MNSFSLFAAAILATIITPLAAPTPAFAAAAAATTSEDAIYLRDNLKNAHPGDFIVIAQDNNYTLLHIRKNDNDKMVVEEIAITAARYQQQKLWWKEWVEKGAPGNTSWVVYTINLTNGHINDYYSVTRKAWCEVPQADIFLSKLLMLRLRRLAADERKRVGPPPAIGSPYDWRPFWQPKMVFEGREVANVRFDAWRAIWPRDNSPLSGKQIDVFIPEDNQKYPTYFPYWLQVTGIVGKAKIRIIDAGTGLTSH